MFRFLVMVLFIVSTVGAQAQERLEFYSISRLTGAMCQGIDGNNDLVFALSGAHVESEMELKMQVLEQTSETEFRVRNNVTGQTGLLHVERGTDGHFDIQVLDDETQSGSSFRCTEEVSGQVPQVS